MVFIPTLQKNSYYNKKYKGYWVYNSICNQQPPNNFIIPNLFYTNKLVQKHNENVFTNTLGLKFIFKVMDIHHQSCPPFYKLSNDPSKTMGLHFTIQIKIYVLVTM